MSSWYGMAPSLCVWGYSCAMTSAAVADAKDLIGASPRIELDYSNYQCGLLHSESHNMIDFFKLHRSIH